MLSKKRNFLQKILLICKGIGMGVANKIPGVSGGIVALAAGFYEELIFFLFQNSIKQHFPFLLKGELRAFYQQVNGSFLSLLFLE